MINKHLKLIFEITLLLAFAAVLSDCATNEGPGEVSSVEPKTKAVGKELIFGRPRAQVGNHAPDFQLMKTDGVTISLADLRGKPAVLVFWSSWCHICKEEAPLINALAAEYESRGVRVLGINIRDSAARTEGGIRDFGIRYPVARDTDASVAHAYQVTGTPTIVFLDRDGVVRYFDNVLPVDYARMLDSMLTGGL